MTNRRDFYIEQAERLAHKSVDGDYGNVEERALYAAQAQVYATLALTTEKEEEQ